MKGNNLLLKNAELHNDEKLLKSRANLRLRFLSSRLTAADRNVRIWGGLGNHPLVYRGEPSAIHQLQTDISQSIIVSHNKSR
jgi:hypothetical protein